MKKLTSFLLALCILFCGLPFCASAAEASNGWYTPSGGKAISLGTAAILNPVSDGHQWQRIYFGTYNNNPIDFRILSKSTTEFSEGTNTPTMLLEHSGVLFTKQVDSVVWSESSIRSDLNGDFLTKSFTSQEQSAINASKKSQSTTDAHLSVALNGEKIFILDYQEYSALKYGFKANAYVGKTALTRTRNASQNDKGEYVYKDSFRLTTHSSGMRGYALVGDNPGISPALNIKLSSVLFTKNVSGDVTAYDTATNPAYYKLSLVNTALTAAVNGNAVKTGNTVSIPYKVTGNDATQLSVMILDKPYTAGNTNGAVMKYYATLATVTSQKTGTVNFSIPTEFSAKVPCKDYYIYIVAEDINGEKATDYASTPVLVTPKYPVTYKPGTNGTGSSKTVYKTTGTALTLDGAIFTRPSYRQIGWSLTEGGAKAYNLSASYTTEKEITLYPVWEKNIFTVTYKPGTDGTGTEQTANKNKGTDLQLKGAIFTRPAYTQVGWAESENGAKKYDLGASYKEEKDVVLYPAWEKKVYTISITYNAPADSKTVTVTGNWDTSVLSKLTQPTYTDSGRTLEYLGLKYFKDKHTLVDITADTKFGDIIEDESEASISLTVTPKWKYKVQTSQELVWAIQNRVTNIVLESDINVTENLDFEAAATTAASNRTCTTLDLNGYVLTGDFEIKLLNADLVLIDSRPTSTHSDLSLPRGGIIGEEVYIYATSSGDDPMDWPSSTIYANGGTVLGETELKSTNQSYIKNTADTVTVFAGQVKAYSNIDGGIYLKTVTIHKNSNKYITKGIFYGGLTDESRIDPNSKVITVSFDLTGAQGNISKQIFVGVDSYKAIEPENIPTAADRTFICWSTDDGGAFDFEANEISENTTLYPTWEVTVSTAAELKSAVEVGDYSIVLGADIALDSDVVFGAGTKYFDLNGHILSGGSNRDCLSMKIQNGDIILSDSNPEAAHIGTSLPEGGIIDGFEIEISCGESISSTMLYANGGTVTGTVSISNASASIVSNGGTPTSFRGTVNNTFGTINGGRYFAAVENSAKITGGSFYGGIIDNGDKASVTGKKFTVNYNSNGGSSVLPQVFVNVVSEKMLAPAAPTRSGYKLAYWSRGNLYFDFRSTAKTNMTLTAIWALPGDANGDGAVDILDLVRIKKYTSGTADCKPENKAATDMNDSGGIDSLDLTLLKKLLLGISN